jgi:hypothetical protein
MRIDLRPPGFSEQIIMEEDPPVGFQLLSLGQADDKRFICWAYQLCQVAWLGEESDLCVIHKPGL